MFTPDIKKIIEQNLENYFNIPMTIIETKSISGGCINMTAEVKTNNGSFFIKTNRASLFPEMFEAEMKGLQKLRDACCINVPQPFFTGNACQYSFLLMNFIKPAVIIANFWDDFGCSLAMLHKNTHASFGLDHNNYIGSLPQNNDYESSWPEFFAMHRLEKQTALAYNKALIDKRILKHFENLYAKLSEIFPEEPPALLHGDLWCGNYLTNDKGKACIIDPSVYYGHREMDLAMSKLFGGFSNAFYEAYNIAYPLETGWEQRIEICNLYPLLVHLNLFGKSYLSDIEAVVKRF